MTDKQSNQENQHTDSKVTEEKGLQSTEPSSKQPEPKKSADETTYLNEESLRGKEMVEARSDKQVKSNEEESAPSKGSDQPARQDSKENVLDEDPPLNRSEEEQEQVDHRLEVDLDQEDQPAVNRLEQEEDQTAADSSEEELEQDQMDQDSERDDQLEDSSSNDEYLAVKEESQEAVVLPAKVADEASNDEKLTREKRRKNHREKKPRLRLIPIWLRILISIVLIGGCLILGLMFGYGIIGGGQPSDAIKPETWYHIRDIIRGN